MIENINLDSYVKENSKIYPFDEKNIQLFISFQKKLKIPEPGKIEFLSFRDGKICYETYDSEQKNTHLLLEQTYQDAVKIIQQEHPEILKPRSTFGLDFSN